MAPLEGPPGLPRAGGLDAVSPPDAGTHLCSSSSPLGGEAHPGGCWAQLVVFPEVTLPMEMATFKQNQAGLTREDQAEAGSCLLWRVAPGSLCGPLV